MLKDELIVVDNKIIEASISLTTLEYRLILCCLSQIKKNDTEFNEINISIKQFKKIMNIKGENYYNVIKKHCKKLAFKGITIVGPDTLKGPKGMWATWFSYIRANDGNIYIKFNELLKNSLLNLSKNFTKYYLKNIISLNSFYAMRIYELLKQYEKIGSREIDVSSLRYMLGIDDNKYTDFYDIKRKILEPSVREINNKTDIRIFTEAIKEGRKIARIKFNIITNISDEKEESMIMAFKNATGQTLDRTRLKELIDKKGLEVVNFYINNFHRFMQFSDVREPVKLFYTAVINGYEIPDKSKKDYCKNKPVQSTNFEQRVYDDEYFESLYENFK